MRCSNTVLYVCLRKFSCTALDNPGLDNEELA